MEHFAFIVTAWACAIVAFCTWCDSKKHEEETRVEERIVRAIQTYVDKSIQHFKQEIVRDHLKKQEYLAQCLLFRTVYIVEEIQGIRVISTGPASIVFDDVHVYDWNGENISIERLHDKRDIDFKFAIGFKYIEFIGLNIWNSASNKCIINFLAADKTVLCTTTISMKKHKIYNTAFLCTL